MDTETNPVEVEDTSADTLPEDQEVEQTEAEQEPELDEDGNPIDTDEEIELDDLKLKVPKDQAQKVREAMLRQADYTRKTQELAESRRAFDTERAQIYQSTQAELNAFAETQNIGRQLAAYQQTNWQAWAQEDPFAAQEHFMHFQTLKDAHQGAMNQLAFLHQQRQAAAKQETDSRIGEGRTVLEREIGWNDTLKASLTDYALGMGLSRDDLSDLEANPAAAKILHEAWKGSKTSRNTAAANKHLAAQAVQPAAKAGGGNTPIPTNKLDDRLSAKEWMRRRENQLAAKSRRR